MRGYLSLARNTIPRFDPTRSPVSSLGLDTNEKRRALDNEEEEGIAGDGREIAMHSFDRFLSRDTVKSIRRKK